jgi:hypothetical protein
MKIQEAVAIFKSEIDQWAKEYLERQKEYPDAWPTEMQEEDWFEQFQFFCMRNCD